RPECGERRGGGGVSTFGISPFPVWDDLSSASAPIELDWGFISTSEHELGARKVGNGVFALGSDTAWDASHHDLKVHCRISRLPPKDRLFGPAGIVCATATRGVALEWKSATSAVRGQGVTAELRQTDLDSGLKLDLE